MAHRSITIELNGEHFTVSGTYHSGTAGSLYGGPDGVGYPPEPSEFEIKQIEWWNLKTGTAVDVTDMIESFDDIYEQINELTIKQIES